MEDIDELSRTSSDEDSSYYHDIEDEYGRGILTENVSESDEVEWIQTRDCSDSEEEVKYERPGIESYIIRSNTDWIMDDIFYTDGDGIESDNDNGEVEDDLSVHSESPTSDRARSEIVQGSGCSASSSIHELDTRSEDGQRNACSASRSLHAVENESEPRQWSSCSPTHPFPKML